MGLTFLKKGKDAQAAVAQADVEAEEAKKGNTPRFWIDEDKEGQITFLDGDLDKDGVIDCVMYREHQLKMNGHWRNWYVCIGETDNCPICESDHKANLVAALTVIDHRSFTDRKGKVHQHQKKLFVCKKDTYKLLQKIATKRGGLAGVTVDVSRTGDQPNVGGMFDFVQKQSLEDVAKQYNLKVEDVKPYNYEEVIVYRDKAALRKLGFGSKAIGATDTTSSVKGVNAETEM